jgi:predicted alpha/beta-fold hydrolase
MFIHHPHRDILIIYTFCIASNLYSMFGRADIQFEYSVQSVEFQEEQGSDVSLIDICRKVTPSCHLNPLLFNGHLQTIWTVVKNDSVPIYYKRKIFEGEDPNFAGSFAVDFVVDPYEKIDSTLPSRTTYYTDDELESIGSLNSRPMLVALHGLSGGSHEVYLRHVLAPLFEKDQDWEACVVNARGCAMSKITSSVLFNARATWDTRQVVKWLRKTFPNRPLFGIGFSLGANILVNVRIEIFFLS